MSRRIGVRTIQNPGGTEMPLEGNYSTWTLKWSSLALSALSGYGLCFGAVDVNGKRVYLRDTDGNTAILNLDTGSIISDEDLGRFYIQSFVPELAHSIKGKYVVIRESDTAFRIYKDGSLQQTIILAGAVWSGFAVNSDGKYIIAHNFAEDKVYCYEGS